jgi:hypothetical protein
LICNVDKITGHDKILDILELQETEKDRLGHMVNDQRSFLEGTVLH